jgi:hypothetical protein
MAGLVDPVGVSCLMSPVALGCGENLINIIAGLHERAMRYALSFPKLPGDRKAEDKVGKS